MKSRNLRWLLAGVAVLAACSDEPGTAPEREPVTFTIYASHDRITTPGRITFTASSEKPLTRVEVYESGRKVGERIIEPLDLHVVEVVVTSADNGARSYIVKGYDRAGNVGTSDPIAVEVDIRWDSFRVLEGYAGGATAFDATGALYVTRGINEGGNQDLTVAKYAADGKQLWLSRFGGPLGEGVGSIGVGPAGRVHLAGGTYDPASQRSDCFLLIYEATGSMAWVQRIAPTSRGTTSCAAASDAAGNYYLAGWIVVSLTRVDLFLAKFDPSGNLLWMRQYEKTGEVPLSVAVDPLGEVYVCGYIWFVDGRRPIDAFLVKFDADGNKVWAREYGGADRDIPTGLTPDAEGGVYVVGETERGSEFPEVGDVFIARFGPDGTLLWDRRFDGGNRDHAGGVAANQSAVYLVGTTRAGTATSSMTEPRQGPQDAFLAKLSRSGDPLWVRLLGGPHREEGGFGGAFGTHGLGLHLGTNGDVTVLVAARSLTTVPGGGIVLARHRDVTP